MPSAHTLQDAAEPVEYAPAAQAAQLVDDADAEAADAVPGTQPLQFSPLDAPVTVEYRPAAQLVHAASEVVAAYVPAAHGAQAAWPDKPCAAPRAHPVHADAPEIAKDPGRHASQLDEV